MKKNIFNLSILCIYLFFSKAQAFEIEIQEIKEKKNIWLVVPDENFKTNLVDNDRSVNINPSRIASKVLVSDDTDNFIGRFSPGVLELTIDVKK